MMRALADYHHASLFRSLQYLFDRLGVELYTPVGHDWWDAGYWRFGQGYGDDRLAGQFLMEPLTRMVDGEFFDPAYPDKAVHGVTLEEARQMDWTYVVATVDDNQHGFSRLAKEWGAQYVLQVGNTRQYIDWSLDPLALVSSEMPILGRGVVYHQEFDSDGAFGFADPFWSHDPDWKRRSHITSFVNLMPLIDCAPVMNAYRDALGPEHLWRIFGIECPDGIIKPASRIAAVMGGSDWGWHDKVTGDGFGHVIHNWAAIGRPLIGHASHYRGKLAEPFWQDGVTCIDLDRRSFDENVRLIREVSADPDRHVEMCRAIRAEFDRQVDYTAEAAAIASLLGVREAVAA